MRHIQIASTIAYSMDHAGFTREERARMATVFADDLRLTGMRRRNFLRDCKKASEIDEDSTRGLGRLANGRDVLRG